MALQPLTTTIAEFQSWNDDTRYARRAMIDDMLADPIFSLLGEDTSNNRSSVLSTNGVDYSGFAKAKVPGGQVNREAPVEADTHSMYYITFVQRFDYEREAILHDQYGMLDPSGTNCLERLWDGVGLFLTNCIWNYNTSSTIDVPAQTGVINYTITTPDGQPIVSASHSGPGYSGKTNIGGTAAFSGPAAVANIDVGHQNRKTPSGVARAYNPDAFLLGNNAALLESMKQYTGSEKVFSSNNNALRVWQNGSMDIFQFKHAPRDTAGNFDMTTSKLHKWATINKQEFKAGFKYKWIEKPTVIEGPRIDTDNLDTFNMATCRIAFMPEDPWAMIQNNASTAPISAY
jgi:hypothetical protein